MSWPIFFKDNLIVGNPNSNIGICTLWSKKDTIAKGLDREKFCVIGNLYTTDGISYMIKNILANPVVTRLIICGADMSNSGETLKNLFDNGVDDNGLIIGSDKYLHSNLKKEFVEIIRKNVKLMDLRNREKEIQKTIDEIGVENEKFASPLVLEDEKGESEEIATDIVGFRLEGGLQEVWLKILNILMKFGEVKKSQHSMRQKEALDVLAVIKDDFSIKSFFGIKQDELEKYLEHFFSDVPKEDIEYNYGTRLFKFAFKWVDDKFKIELNFFVNQIDNIVEMLKQTPFTRRAVASLWNPFSDMSSQNPPCLTQISWCVKNSKLYQTCTFRSHDVFGAYLLNAIALRKLQEKVADKLGMLLGDLVILSHSAHIYENYWMRAEDILEKEYRNREMRLEEDRAGYFRIYLVNGEIVVQHYLPEGKKSKFEFRGKEAASLYRRILNENIVSRMDHAAYLGKELARAEICLKEGKKYEQDAA